MFPLHYWVVPHNQPLALVYHPNNTSQLLEYSATPINLNLTFTKFGCRDDLLGRATSTASVCKKIPVHRIKGAEGKLRSCCLLAFSSNSIYPLFPLSISMPLIWARREGSCINMHSQIAYNSKLCNFSRSIGVKERRGLVVCWNSPSIGFLLSPLSQSCQKGWQLQHLKQLRNNQCKKILASMFPCSSKAMSYHSSSGSRWSNSFHVPNMMWKKSHTFSGSMMK